VPIPERRRRHLAEDRLIAAISAARLDRVVFGEQTGEVVLESAVDRIAESDGQNSGLRFLSHAAINRILRDVGT